MVVSGGLVQGLEYANIKKCLTLQLDMVFGWSHVGHASVILILMRVIHCELEVNISKLVCPTSNLNAEKLVKQIGPLRLVPQAFKDFCQA